MKMILALFGIGFLVLAGMLLFLYMKAKHFAKEAFGTDNLKEIIQTQEEQLEHTPKSVSGMTSLYLPRLQADFPELNWIEFKSDAEKHLMNYLKNEQKVTSPLIHQTELRDYRKNSGTCYVIFESSVQFLQSTKKIQTRFHTVMAYIQDASQMGYEAAFSMNCPNCGAPVVQLGNKKICEYCGSDIVAVNTRIWSLDRIEEVLPGK